MRPLALLAGLVTLATLTGCYRPYRPPRANEPHAVLKFRRVYETTKGTSLHETAMIGSDMVFDQNVGLDVLSPESSDALLVHPRRSLFRVENNFFHIERRMVSETYFVSVPYTTTESYACGDYRSYRTCSRTVTSYRSESRTQMVMRDVAVTDAACVGTVALHPEVGQVYLLQYTFRDDQACSLDCYVQTPSSDGQVTQSPCPVPPPPPPPKSRWR